MPLQETESCRWFATEVQPHERSLRSYLRARFPSVADVDDLVQETYARLVRAHRVDRARITRGYIFVTARNLALDLLRRRAAVPFEDLDENTASFVVAESADVAETVSHNQELALLREALCTLPPRCAAVVHLRCFEGLAYRDVAARLGIAEATVNSQLSIGLIRCREYLSRHGVARAHLHVHPAKSSS
jgi:RNA polymerase sigma-70 factor (ECF subfamily)